MDFFVSSFLRILFLFRFFFLPPPTRAFFRERALRAIVQTFFSRLRASLPLR